MVQSKSAAAQQPPEPAQTAAEQATQGGKPPIDRFHIGGVHVSIWQKPSAKGDFRTASVQLRYKDKDGNFQDSNSYGATDLKNLAEAPTEAKARIDKWNDEQKAKAHKGQSR